MKLRLTIATLVAALWPALAAHAAPRSYAVLSLVGDELTIVSYQPVVGHAIDQNRREVVPLPEPVLDQHVLVTIDQAIRASDTSAAPVLLAMPAASVPKDQLALFDGSRFQPGEALATALKSSGATHLIIVTKHRGEANLQMLHNKIGSGKLEGLGFYVDEFKRVRNTDTREVGLGFIAPYAYVRASLVDLATFEVLREHAFVETETFASSRGGDGVSPWKALSPGEKIGALERLLGRELRKAMPELLAP